MNFIRFIILCGLTFFSLKGESFTLINGPEVEGYEKEEVVFDYNFGDCPQGEAAMKPVMEEALKRWSDIPGSRLVLKIGESVTTTADQAVAATRNAFDQVDPPVLICDSNFQVNYNASGNTGSADGVGGIGTAISNGDKIVAGWVLLNLDGTTVAGTAAQARSASSFRTLITHELGHALGLHHSEDSSAMMSPGAALNMTQDDFDGIRYLYPVHGEKFDEFLGCAVGSLAIKGGGPRPPRSGMFIISLLLGIMLISLKSKIMAKLNT